MYILVLKGVFLVKRTKERGVPNEELGASRSEDKSLLLKFKNLKLYDGDELQNYIYVIQLTTNSQ